MSFELRLMNLESILQSEVKSEREKQILHINTYIWNLERLMNLFAGQQFRHRHRVQTYGHSGNETYPTTVCEIDSPV